MDFPDFDGDGDLDVVVASAPRVGPLRSAPAPTQEGPQRCRSSVGYKCFKKEAILSINLKEKSFGIEPEITVKLSKKNFKFFEVPISYNGRSYEEGKKIGLKDAFIALKAIFLYSFKS